jgi:4-hydroxybenzoate polyprenyltransferase
LKLQNVPLALNGSTLLVLSTVLLAAGYVINDIFDQDTDIENRPKDVIVVQKMAAYNIYFLNSTGC